MSCNLEDVTRILGEHAATSTASALSRIVIRSLLPLDALGHIVALVGVCAEEAVKSILPVPGDVSRGSTPNSSLLTKLACGSIQKV